VASRPFISLSTDLKADLTAQEKRSSPVQSSRFNEIELDRPARLRRRINPSPIRKIKELAQEKLKLKLKNRPNQEKLKEIKMGPTAKLKEN
jgi:hypothetical protein